MPTHLTTSTGASISAEHQYTGGGVAIDAAAYLKVGTISEPIYDDTVSTKGGYWLINVLEKEDQRPVDDEIMDKMRADAFTEWISEQRDNSDIEELIESI